MPQKPDEGWVVLSNATLEHYVVDGRSLCGRWGYFGTTFYPTTRGGCEQCKKRLEKRIAAAAKEKRRKK